MSDPITVLVYEPSPITVTGDINSGVSVMIPVASTISGPAGADGNRWYSQAGAPTSSIGANDDYDLNLTNYDIYNKVLGAWSNIGNIKGATGSSGADGAPGSSGADGAPGSSGADGAPGSSGADGADGSLWYVGAGVPSSSLGVNTDCDLDNINGNFYQKAAGIWVLQGNLTGPAGSSGATGSSGADGAPGSSGADGSRWYVGAGVPSSSLGVDNDCDLNNANGDYYQKAAGVWGLQGNLTGPAGSSGADGAPGSSGADGADGTLTSVNGTTIDTIDLDDITPSAPDGYVNVAWQYSSTGAANVSAAMDMGGLMEATRRRVTYVTDCFSNQFGAMAPFYGFAINAGTLNAASTGIVSANHPGVLRIRSSTTATSGARIATDGAMLLLGGGEKSEFTFSEIDMTNTTIRMGFLDGTSGLDAVDGCYIVIGSTGDCYGKTACDSTRSTTATSYNTSINTWYRGKVTLSANATSVLYELYDDNLNLLWSTTLTSNIPIAAGNETACMFLAINSTTTAQNLAHIDRAALSFTRTLTR